MLGGADLAVYLAFDDLRVNRTQPSGRRGPRPMAAPGRAVCDIVPPTNRPKIGGDRDGLVDMTFGPIPSVRQTARHGDVRRVKGGRWSGARGMLEILGPIVKREPVSIMGTEPVGGMNPSGFPSRALFQCGFLLRLVP